MFSIIFSRAVFVASCYVATFMLFWCSTLRGCVIEDRILMPLDVYLYFVLLLPLITIRKSDLGSLSEHKKLCSSVKTMFRF